MLRWIICGALAWALPASVQAQVIQGKLLDADTEVPIATAELSLITEGKERLVATAYSDEAGAFLLKAENPGRFRLRARRIGYQEVTTPPFDLVPGEPLLVELRAGAAAVPLAPLTVLTAPRTSSVRLMTGGFFERRDTWGPAGMGFGHFLDQSDLERKIAFRVSDLLRDLPGVFVEGAGGRGQVVLMRSTMSISRRGCLPGIYVDGSIVRLGAGESIDILATPSDITAIEVYPRTTVPGRFGAMLDAPCGVIAIWTGGRN